MSKISSPPLEDSSSKPSFSEVLGPALTEKSESRHISVPREESTENTKPVKKRTFKKLLASIFCCRRDTTINTSNTIIDIPSHTPITTANASNITRSHYPPNTANTVTDPNKTGQDTPLKGSRRSSFTGNAVTQQIVLSPEKEVQQQMVAAVAAVAVAQAGGDEAAQHDAARKSGEIEPHYLLPPLDISLTGKKCLVLDLDETLVHSSFKLITQADFVVPVEIENQAHNVYVLKRPGVDEFMKQVGEHFEIVVFTASLSKYADPVLDLLDRYHVVHHRLFRESCLNYKGNYVKDLSQLGRDLRSTLIIDNSPASYILHPTNAVPVTSWFSDPHDTELLDMIPFLIDLSRVDDVTQVLDGTLDVYGDEEEYRSSTEDPHASNLFPDDEPRPVLAR